MGAAETTLINLTSAYAPFVNGGKKVEANLITRIQDRRGKTIFKVKDRKCLGCDNFINQTEQLPKIENTNETFKFETLKSEEYMHKDEFFGESRILRNKALIKLNNMTGLDLNNILIKYQGCADIGICYPIQIHKLL